jgi:hypothetical protein
MNKPAHISPPPTDQDVWIANVCVLLVQIDKILDGHRPTPRTRALQAAVNHAIKTRTKGGLTL